MAMYHDYLIGTVESYNKATKKKLLDMIVSKGIATIEDSPSLLCEDVCLGQIPPESRLVHCLNKSPRAVKVIEQFEFLKSYRYAILMKTSTTLDSVKVDELKDKGVITEFVETCTDMHDELGTMLEMPSKVSFTSSDNEYCFKLCFKIDKFDNDGNAISRKFSVLIVAHKQTPLIEIRYDTIFGYMAGGKEVLYLTYINNANKWIEDTLGFSVVDKDAPGKRMHYIVENREKLRANDEAIIIGQGMRFGNGSSADLFLGTSESGVLPLIGELRQFLSDNEEAFRQAPELQKALEDFLEEKEHDSDWPWLSLRLKYHGKNIEIKYTAEKYCKGMCRIMFNENAQYDAEAMSYAIKYITEDNSDNPAIGIADA